MIDASLAHKPRHDSHEALNNSDHRESSTSSLPQFQFSQRPFADESGEEPWPLHDASFWLPHCLLLSFCRLALTWPRHIPSASPVIVDSTAISVSVNVPQGRCCFDIALIPCVDRGIPLHHHFPIDRPLDSIVPSFHCVLPTDAARYEHVRICHTLR